MANDTARYRVLLVEDDQLSVLVTRMLLQKKGLSVDVCGTGAEALERLKTGEAQYALAILDYRLPDGTAEELLAKMRRAGVSTNALVYSGDLSRSAVMGSWAQGAVGFIEKGESEGRLVEMVLDWCAKFEKTKCVLSPETSQPQAISRVGMVGTSAELESVARKIERYRALAQNVLILGETGTGKELVAKALRRSDDLPFLVVNCAAYQGDADLLESELFGHVKGAFSGAIADKRGIFEAASGGIVFLDEVHHLAYAAQARLLRAIQEKKVRKLGSNREIEVGFRLVTAAKPELSLLVESGGFLPDLFHRLSALTIHVPPLRERSQDIEPLVAHFVEKYNRETGEKKTIRVSALRYLEKYPWPGNVRELENALVQILADCPSDCVEPDHLDPKFFRAKSLSEARTLESFKSSQSDAERDFLIEILRSSESKSQAARRLSIAPTTLHSLLVRHKIEFDELR